MVSTHSRPKAAAQEPTAQTQDVHWFQHTAARRRLQLEVVESKEDLEVSTHSRPKAAAKANRH